MRKRKKSELGVNWELPASIIHVRADSFAFTNQNTVHNNFVIFPSLCNTFACLTAFAWPELRD